MPESLFFRFRFKPNRTLYGDGIGAKGVWECIIGHRAFYMTDIDFKADSACVLSKKPPLPGTSCKITFGPASFFVTGPVLAQFQDYLSMMEPSNE